MKIKDIMTSDVETLYVDDTLVTAAMKMRDRDIGFLPVFEGSELIGVLTDRDVIVRAMVEGMDPKTVVGHGLVSSPAIYCFDDQDVEDAARLMHDNQIRRLVILDRGDRRLVGVITLGDLAVNADGKIYDEVSQGVFESAR